VVAPRVTKKRKKLRARIRKMLNWMHVLGSAGLASAATITSSTMMLYLKNHFGKLVSEGDLGVNSSGVLEKSYGHGILATNVITIVLASMLFLMAAMHWYKHSTAHSAAMAVHLMMGLSTMAVVIAIAASGYNLYVHQNIEKMHADANLTCLESTTNVLACVDLRGKYAKAMDGLNISAIVINGLLLMGAIGGGILTGFFHDKHGHYLGSHHGHRHESVVDDIIKEPEDILSRFETKL